MQLAPGPAPSGAMLLDQPLAGATQPQACAVNQQMDGSSGVWRWVWDRQGFGAAAQGRVIGHRKVKPQELEDRADQALCLTQRQPKHRPECQGCSDRQSRIV